ENDRSRAYLRKAVLSELEQRVPEDDRRGPCVRMGSDLHALLRAEPLAIASRLEDDHTPSFVEHGQSVLLSRPSRRQTLRSSGHPVDQRAILSRVEGPLRSRERGEHDGVPKIVIALGEARHLPRELDA